MHHQVFQASGILSHFPLARAVVRFRQAQPQRYKALILVPAVRFAMTGAIIGGVVSADGYWSTLPMTLRL